MVEHTSKLQRSSEVILTCTNGLQAFFQQVYLGLHQVTHERVTWQALTGRVEGFSGAAGVGIRAAAR